ncbi:MAG: hypothetical protein K9M13_03820, partial [Simkaniaceae bacterium]|nr:hypothetical protein [Simkaniaceae bacterium]
YLPFKGFAKIAGHYGIGDFFTPGEGAIILEGKKKIGVSICYEECFGHLMRENRSKGAELFVNLTNDGWFPRSKLPRQHFNHARLRSVEMGIPQIRASNTGFSGAINSFGRVEALLGDRDECGKMIKDIAMIELRDYTYPTLYAKVGDWLIVIVSIAFILIHMISLKIRLAQKNKSSLNS